MNALSTTLGVLLEYSTLLAMWGALLLHRFFPVPSQSNPLHAWRLIGEAISDKVNHADDPPKQQYLTGALSLSVMGLTAAVFLFALKEIVWTSWPFDLLLLWLALGCTPIIQTTLNVEQALLYNDKPSARTALALILNRDTLSLSPIGIVKAACETLLIGYSRNLIGVLFWYGIGGGVTCLLYSLIVQLTRCWSPRIQKYAQFGRLTSGLFCLVDFFPSRLFALLIAFGHRFKPAITAIYEQACKDLNKKNNESVSAVSANNGAAWLQASCGAKYQITFGGPVIYDNHKIQRPHLGGKIIPSPLHLALLNQQLMQKARVWVFLQSILMFLFLR